MEDCIEHLDGGECMICLIFLPGNFIIFTGEFVSYKEIDDDYVWEYRYGYTNSESWEVSE